MSNTKGYKSLVVWKKAMDLAPIAYNLTRTIPSDERFGLCSQIRRAVVSVAANIAEGQGRNHPGEFRQFLGIARGSLAELDTLIIMAENLGFLRENECEKILLQIVEVRMLLQGLIQKLRT
jgi:four helix bundle protein